MEEITVVGLLGGLSKEMGLNKGYPWRKSLLLVYRGGESWLKREGNEN